ncbi:helix-turn-helix transcriptional regulator [Latilactobacillus sakei]|uniref:helix-turn-helix transcriptional regulator n=1 Tax=Latilactobacillus sakei TaxID=1599 RepID=UPI000DC6446D|nr:PAS domain-containing protein [Latilactobacillus sakei]SPS07197.1 YheO-like PAS domain protein [Latilactobacillus sakei]
MVSELERYQGLVHFLGQVLGSNYEVVLHWINQDGSYYIAAIEHAEISGRNLNSPITGFALDLIRDKIYQKQDAVVNYKASSDKNQQIQGSTYFIKDDQGVLLGLLCINFNAQPYLAAIDNLINLANLDSLLASVPTVASKHPQQHQVVTNEEVLHSSVEEIIYTVVAPNTLQSGIKLTQDKKIEICRKLNQKGIFKIKGALSKVAEILGTSEPSIYRYLKLINQS